MLNKYDNGTIYIGKHRDNLENRLIATVSVGAERTFIMTHDDASAHPDNELYKKRWTLANGSLFVMQGETQKHWKHEIVRLLGQQRDSMRLNVLNRDAA